MATGVSGSFNVTTSNEYISGIVYYSETYNIVSNTSDVTVTFKLWRNNSYSGNTTNGAASSFKLWCNGTSHSVSIAASGLTIPPGGTKVTAGSHTFTSIAHNTDGSKTLNIAVEGSLNSCGSAGNITVSNQKKSVTLTKIKRLSSLTVANGTLGTSQNLTVTRQDTSYTHTITAKCGSATAVTIVTKSTSTTIAFTPPTSWAAQNTTGTTVSVTYTIETFTGSTSLGTATKTVTCTIPATIKPSVSISTSDTEGYQNTYGKPVKGKSKLSITLTATLGGSSPINSYQITANGESFTSASATTGVLTGDVTVNATVTDKRGRSGTATKSIAVFDYSEPNITALTVKRCNSDGTENDQGAYIQVTFSGSISALGNGNSAIWKLYYKKPSESSFTTVTISALNNTYTVTNYSKIFAADTGSSYDIKIYAEDDFGGVYKTTAASTASTIMHFKKNGKGMAVGKISEDDNIFDIGYKTRLYGGIQPITLTNTIGFDLNNIKTTGFYTSAVLSENYSNCPCGSNKSFSLEVFDGGVSGQLLQKLTVTSGENCIIYQRFYYQSTWYNWTKIYQQKPVVLWTGSEVLGNDADGNAEYVELSETISSQINGIILVFKMLDTLSHYQNFYISKNYISNYFYSFEMVSYNFTGKSMKLLKFVDNCTNSNGDVIAKITGDINNATSGTGGSNIKYDNSKMTLVKVLGW